MRRWTASNGSRVTSSSGGRPPTMRDVAQRGLRSILATCANFSRATDGPIEVTILV